MDINVLLQRFRDAGFRARHMKHEQCVLISKYGAHKAWRLSEEALVSTPEAALFVEADRQISTFEKWHMESNSMAAGICDPNIGSTVHYMAYNMAHLVAIVINQNGDIADLAVFTGLTNVAGQKNFGLQFHQNVQYSEELQPGTWHQIKYSDTPILDQYEG